MPSPSSRVRTATVHLDDDSVTAVAERVVQLLRAEPVDCELIDAAEVARRFSLSRDYVYEHAHDFGAVRLGDGPKGRLRFDPGKVAKVLAGSPGQETQPKRTAVRPVRSERTVTPLPIRGESP